MMTAVEGYDNGTHIVIDEKIRLHKGQRLIFSGNPLTRALIEPGKKISSLRLG